jgi:1,5-anhydro-D-fructose reductase (1,5-anhydro-D-mannitol-forming)
MPSGAQVFAHESFTHAYAGSGLEIHGAEGSIFARNVMTQQPIGEITLVTKAGREAVSYNKHNLYGEAVRRFVEAVSGTGTVAATGEDGVKSLAVALAVREAAQTDKRVTVDYGA